MAMIPQKLSLTLGKESWPKGPGFGYPQRGFSLQAFKDLRSTGVLEWWSNGRNPFFHRSQKTDPWKKSESLKLFFFKSTLQYSITPVDLYGQSHRTLTPAMRDRLGPASGP
jgi:hypothetical protein